MREAGSAPSVRRRTARRARTSVLPEPCAGPFIDVLEDGAGVVDGFVLRGGEGFGHGESAWGRGVLRRGAAKKNDEQGRMDTISFVSLWRRSEA